MILREQKIKLEKELSELSDNDLIELKEEFSKTIWADDCLMRKIVERNFIGGIFHLHLIELVFFVLNEITIRFKKTL